jgi:peptide-methionine (R)-S-oxide reductase
MKHLAIILLFFFACSCNGQKKNEPKFEVIKTEKEWKSQLNTQQFEVLRNKGTERAFTGEYWNHFENGKYVCAACDNPLFLSTTKFESDCGWPSFDKAIKGAVIYTNDYNFGMSRIEVQCAKCGGHLGHVFKDGPKETTGKRYCTNSVSIKFIPKK